ncbi:PAS domain S-box protein [Flavobacterium antarcticum]|uniref:PAS domain S-box protein n=1 Tax=Flavobacterium antarcticum TaxID=271155 RepID=UPI0003B74A01|nr:PAS domain S-box protein [Flavobacterium antarcticum]
MHDNNTPRIPTFLQHSQTYFALIIDLNGNYLAVNDLFERRFRQLTDDFIGKSALLAIFKDDHARCLSTVDQCFAHPEQSHHVNLRKPHPEADRFYWNSWEFSLLQNQFGAPNGILCVGHDTTESETASQEVRKFATKVETILEEITEGFYQTDTQWHLIRMNRVAESILEQKRDATLEHLLWDVFQTTPDAEFIIQLQDASMKKQMIAFESFHPHLNKWIYTTAYPSVEGLTVFFRDSTAEHESRDTLALSKSKLKAILDSTNDSILLISNTYTLLNFNKTAMSFYHNYLGKTLKQDADIRPYLAPGNASIFKEGFHRATEGFSSTFEIEEDLINEPYWLQITFNPVYDSDNNRIGVTLNSHCINDKKLAELKIRQQEYMLRAIYHSTSEASTFMDTDLVIKYLNQNAKELTKGLFGKEAEIGDNWMEYVLPEFFTDFERWYHEALAGNAISEEITYEDSWWLLRINPVYGDAGVIIGISLIIKDISIEHHRKMQLQDSEQKLHKTMEAIPHPLLIVDEDNLITFVNDEFESVFGYNAAEVLGKTIAFLMPEKLKNSQMKMYHDYLATGRTSRGIKPYLFAAAKDGREVVIHVSMNTFVANEKRFVNLILQDVTELKKHQDTILLQNQALRSIAWQHSHEVRKPIANILGMYHLLKDDQNANEVDRQDYLDHLYASTEELDLIIHKIVKESHETNKFPPI